MKNNNFSEKSPVQPRTNARKSKLRDLTPIQTQTLLRWLVEENYNYEVARKRMQKDFAVSLSMAQMSEFWHSQVKPQAPVSNGAGVLIEMVIHAGQSVRLVIKEEKGDSQR